MSLTGQGWPNVRSVTGEILAYAAQMCIKDINDNDDILPGYKLNLEIKDTEMNMGKGLKAFVNLTSREPTKIMLIGPILSEVSTPVAEIARTYNLVLISNSPRTPLYSDRVRFGHVFRVSNGDDELLSGLLTLFRETHCHNRVGIIYRNKELSGEYSRRLQVFLERPRYHPINVKTTQSFNFNSTDLDPGQAVRLMRQKRVRVIFGAFPSEGSLGIFCQAYKRGLYVRRGVRWILLGYRLYLDQLELIDPVKLGCTRRQIEKVLEGSFYVNFFYEPLSEPFMSSSGKTLMDFNARMKAKFPGILNVESFMAETMYDTSLAAALALDKARHLLPSNVHLEDFTYDNKVIPEALKKALKNLSFEGMSGPVSFNSLGCRISHTIVGHIKALKTVDTGMYDPLKKKIRWFGPKMHCRTRGHYRRFSRQQFSAHVAA